MSKPVTSTEEGRKSSQVPGLLRPAERGERHQRRGEPGVEHVLVAACSSPGVARAPRAQRHCACASSACGDVDVAVVVVPRRYAVAPPELARDAPVLDVLEPLVVGGRPVLGHELDVARRRPPRGRACASAVHLHEPLVGQHGLDDLVGAARARHAQLVRLLRDEEPVAARSSTIAARASKRSSPRYFRNQLEGPAVRTSRRRRRVLATSACASSVKMLISPPSGASCSSRPCAAARPGSR